MDPTESCTKRTKIAVADVDRISQLPDDLQILILSLLSTKEAFKASLLAKTFKNRWARVRDVNLDFDDFRPDDDTLDDPEGTEEEQNPGELGPDDDTLDDPEGAEEEQNLGEFGPDDDTLDDPEDAEEEQNLGQSSPDDGTSDDLDDSEDEKKLWKLPAEEFKKFGDRILNNPDKLRNLEKLNLKWVEGKTDPSPASKWLDTVAKQNLKFLSVHISSQSDFRVPDSIFSCESLEEMELNLENEIIAPPQESVHLPHLKKLTLHSIFIGDGVMQKLSGLPALEEMVVFQCYFRTCEISSDTLKRLELKFYDNFNNETAVNETDITISTPHLLYLELLPCAKGTIKLNNMESLVKACIYYDADSLFLAALSNASDLELMLAKSGVLEMKDALKEETTEFPNLKTLKIGEWCMTDEFDVVDYFLSNARNLQKLTLLHRHQLPSGHEKMEISLELARNNVNVMESHDKEKDKIKVDEIAELVNRVSNTLSLLG